jgi:hypothetical protein
MEDRPDTLRSTHNVGSINRRRILIRAHLHGYQNKQLEQDYLKGRPHNVYTAIIEEVMTDLVALQVAIREEGTIFY